MAKNKYYAVKVGRTIGILNSWEDCKESIDGFPGSKYKGFKTYEEAEMYLNLEEKNNDSKSADSNVSNADYLTDPKSVNIFTDGSYNKDLKFISYGYVMFTNESDIKTSSAAMFDKGDSQNVTGEVEGVISAIKSAIYYGYKKVKIFHDYIGVCFWAKGEWKTKTPIAIKYKDFIDSVSKDVEIIFQHVKGHSGNRYNDMADSLARNELKSLLPDDDNEWGYKSYKFDDDRISKILNKIKNDFNGFVYVTKDKGNHLIYNCSLNNETVQITKYKFNSGNKLLMKRNEGCKLFSIIQSYLNDVGKIDSLVQTLNANNNTNFTNDEVKSKLYEISPSFKNRTIDTHIYRLLLTAVYEVMRDAYYIGDTSHIILPAMRALEGHLKKILLDNLNITIGKNGFTCFDKDSLGNKVLQNTYKSRIDNSVAIHIEKCYNIYCNVRNVFLHFGNVQLGDTQYMNLEESKSTIIDTLKTIEEYYL